MTSFSSLQTRLLRLVLVILVLFYSFYSCFLPMAVLAVSPQQAATATPAPASQEAISVVQKIKQRNNTVVVGVRYDFQPFGFVDAQGQVVGFDVDLLRAMAKQWGVEVQFVQVTASNRIQTLTSGLVDILAASMTHRQELEEKIDFSQTYFLDGQSLLVEKYKGLLNIKDLDGKTIAALQGSTSIDQLLFYAKQNGVEVNVLPFQEFSPAILALKAGQVAAVTADSVALLQATIEDSDLAVIGGRFSYEPYGLGLPSDDSDFRNLVDYTLQQLKLSGEYDKIYTKWFADDTPYPVEITPGKWPYPFASSPITRTVAPSRLDLIQVRKQLVVGVQYDHPPFGFLNDKGELAGFDLDLAKEFAKRLLGDPNALSAVQVTSSSRIPVLASGETDLVLASMVHTWEDESKIDFSQTYFADAQRLLVNKAAEIQSLADLNKRTIGVVVGAGNQEPLQLQASKLGITLSVLPFQEYAAALNALVAGQIDALTAGESTLNEFAKQNPKLVVVGNRFAYQPYGIGMPNADSTLRDAVNLTLAAIKADGTYDALSEKWFGDSVQPYAIELWPTGANVTRASAIGPVNAQPQATEVAIAAALPVTSTVTNTLTPTLTPKPTATSTNTAKPTATATNTSAPTATATNTPKPTATLTNTPKPTATTTNTTIPTATSTNTPKPTATATNTAMPTATATNTPKPTATATHTVVPTATPTHTPKPTATATHTAVPTATATNTPKPTATSTNTAVPTATATNTPVPTATLTHTPKPTATATNTPVPTATSTDTPEPTATATNTPKPTATATNTAVPTATATNTAVPTATSTNTPKPTATVTHTAVPTVTSTNTPKPTATATNTAVPTATSTNTAVPTATATNTPKPTATATNTMLPTATVTNTPVPTATSTNTPKPTATATNTDVPTATSTNTPKPTATATNTTVPTATATNTPKPTATATSTPLPTSTPIPTATVTNTPVPTATSTHTPKPTATSTAVPTVTPIEELSGPFVTVPARLSINARYSTSRQSEVLQILNPGETAPAIGRDILGIWIQIRLADGRPAWVYSGVVEISNEAIQALPVVAVPPAIEVDAAVTATPEPTDTPTPIPASGRIHVVEEGDNLWDLAEFYYQDPTQWVRIYEANRQLIGDNPARLKLGMELIIP